MKKIWIVMMMVCAILSFTACSKKVSQQQNPPQTTESTVSGKETPEDESAPPAETKAPGETEEFKILNGRITAVSDTMSDMTVESDGKELTFDLNGVGIETSFSLEPDTNVSIVYKGEVSGADTSNANAILVLDAQDEMQVKTIVGSVTSQAMSTFTIKPDDGTEMGFLKVNCEGLSTGVLGQASDDNNGSGARVKVTYVTVHYDAGSESNFPLKVEAAR